jgi:hypothetical protein
MSRKKWIVVIQWHTKDNTKDSQTVELQSSSASEALVKGLKKTLPNIPNESHIEYSECWVHGLADISDSYTHIDIAMKKEQLQRETIETIIKRYS